MKGKTKKRKLIVTIALIALIAIMALIYCVFIKKEVSVSSVKGIKSSNVNDSNTVYKITFNRNEGSGGKSYLYISNGTIYKDAQLSEPLGDDEAMKMPTKDGYKFRGYYLGQDKVISSIGTIIGSNKDKITSIKDNTEIIAKYNPVTTVDFDFNDGANGTTKVYISFVSSVTEDLKMYSDKACTSEIGKIEVPQRVGCNFLGYKIKGASTAQGYSFDSNGELLEAKDLNLKQEIAEYYKIDRYTGIDYTLIASWEEIPNAPIGITLNKSDGIGGKSDLYVKDSKIYKDVSCTEELMDDEKIEIPVKDGYKFRGYYLGQDKIISSLGTITAAHKSEITTIKENVTLVAKYNPVNTVDFDFNDGANGTTKIYMSFVSDVEQDLKMYSDKACTNEIDKVEVPQREGYKFLGYKIKNASTAQGYSIDANGNLLEAKDLNLKQEIAEYYKIDRYTGVDYTLIASWEKVQETAEKYTINFNKDEGIGGTDFVYIKDKKLYKDSDCTVEIAKIEIPTKEGYIFKGYKFNAQETEYSFDENGNLVAGGSLSYLIENEGISDNLILYAIWEKNEEPEVTEVKYTIEHYKEQEDKTYSLEETENKTGTVGETVTATQKTYEGYIYNSSKSNDNGVVVKEGTLVLKMYYSLKENVINYTVKYYKEDSTGNYTEVIEDKTTETGKIGETVTAKVKAYEGYMYNSEKSKETMTGVVKEDETLELGVYYTKLKSPYIEITTTKENVKVTLYDNEGKQISTKTSDIIGKVAFESLEKGKTYSYKIEGDSKEYKFKVTQDGKIEYITDEEEKPDEDNKGNNVSGNNTSTTKNQVSTNTDNTKASSTLPKAGIKGKVITSIIVLLVAGIGIFYVKYKKWNKIC